MKILIFFLAVCVSCNLPQQSAIQKSIRISLSKIPCGSYEVKEEESSIGYVVKPYYIEIDNSETYISHFELLLRKDYYSCYEKYFRTYWFTKNSISDTLIFVQMLSLNQVKVIPNWQCEEQEVDLYNQLAKKKLSNKCPNSFIYNCTKGRLKIVGDPD